MALRAGLELGLGLQRSLRRRRTPPPEECPPAPAHNPHQKVRKPVYPEYEELRRQKEARDE